jgi:hypothetical protein
MSQQCKSGLHQLAEAEENYMAVIFGTTGSDTRNGTSGNDTIFGGLMVEILIVCQVVIP